MPYDVSRLRWLILDRARQIARTGDHTDHSSVIACLKAERPRDYARVQQWVEDQAFMMQITDLCEAAQRKRP